MSVQSEYLRIQGARNTIRNKMVSLGIGLNTDKLDALATKFDGITDNGAVQASVKEGESYTVPAGWHNGTGVVKGVAGGGSYGLQEKTATPTKTSQSITSDEGYYGLSGVTINPIPDAYQDVSSTTVTAAEVLLSKVFVDAAGTVTAGTMPNNGAISKNLSVSTTSYTIPAGYHNGSGKVYITTETKSITPTTEIQDIDATSGKVISKISVGAIGAKYGDASALTNAATEALILSGKKAIVYNTADAKAVTITGSMTNRGAVSVTLSPTSSSYTVPAGYHNGSGTVSLTLQEANVSPSFTQQIVEAEEGKTLSKVTVAAIDSKYKDLSSFTPTIKATDLKYGVTAISKDSDGNPVEITGSMQVNNLNVSFDAYENSQVSIPEGYYDSTRKVVLTDNLENQLASI